MSTSQQNAKRIYSLAHGSTVFDQPIGFEWDSAVEWKKNKHSITVTNIAICADDIDVTAMCKFQGLVTPITPETKDDITAMVEQFDGNDAEIDLPDMKSGSAHGDCMGAIFFQTQSFKYEGTSTMPISVTLV